MKKPSMLRGFASALRRLSSVRTISRGRASCWGQARPPPTSARSNSARCWPARRRSCTPWRPLPFPQRSRPARERSGSPTRIRARAPHARSIFRRRTFWRLRSSQSSRASLLSKRSTGFVACSADESRVYLIQPCANQTPPPLRSQPIRHHSGQVKGRPVPIEREASAPNPIRDVEPCALDRSGWR